MKQKELINTSMVISNWKKTFQLYGSLVYTEIFKCFEASGTAPPDAAARHSVKKDKLYCLS